MIFPGMDPYLEDPDVWPGFHNAFIVYLAEALRGQIRPRYVASLEGRVYIQQLPGRFFIPDVSVRRGPAAANTPAAIATLEPGPFVEVTAEPWEANESYLRVLDRENDLAVVAIIELLSPTNKVPGRGRREYLRKQRNVLQSQAHLIEIDLLRTGRHTLAVPANLCDRVRPFHYMVSVNRSARVRNHFRLFPVTLNQPLPVINVPLADVDPDAAVDLKAIFTRTYEAGDYHWLVRYDRPCVPPLSPEDQAWADERIKAARASP